jgi:hypothetical protein
MHHARGDDFQAGGLERAKSARSRFCDRVGHNRKRTFYSHAKVPNEAIE